MGCTDVGIGEIAVGPSSDPSLLGFPNPFRSSMAIRLDLAENGQGSLTILDVSGRVVRVLEQGHFHSGRNELTWDGRDRSGERVPGGVYFSELRISGQREVRRIVLLP